MDPHTSEDEAPEKRKHKLRKRKSIKVPEDGPFAAREKLVKRILLTLTKPSYTLTLGSNNLRSENRRRLRYLLRRLVRQHNWVEASGVLSVYMLGTVKDNSPLRNQFKYSVLLELLKHVENNPINPTRIRNLYDVWIRKNGSMKTWPAEKRYAVQLEFILFCLLKGNHNEAHQATICLKQEKNADGDPVSNMLMGLTFYELWYSCIPKEFQWRDSDQFDSPGNAHMAGTRFSNQVGCSEWHNAVESRMADTPCQCYSDTSVMNGKEISMGGGIDQDMGVSMKADVNHQNEKPVHNFQPQGFYLNSDEQTGNGDQFSNHRGHMQDASSLYALGGLDSWLLPLHLPDRNSIEEFIYVHKQLVDSYYEDAVNHLRLAVDSTPSVSAALLPLTQLLLIGGQVDEALNRLEKQCCNPASVLPIRSKAALLECFDPNNSLLHSKHFEDILKKDPTCCDSLAKLITMHKHGEYSLESLLEMIALHLEATYAEYNTWKEFALCFFKLSHYEDDCLSTCPANNEDGNRQYYNHSSLFSGTLKIFTEGISGEAWRLRCRWWLSRHFSEYKLESEIEAGDLQLLTYKATCASYMYGQEFDYVVKAYSHLAKENDKDLLLFWDSHKHNSCGIYPQVLQKAK